VLVNYRGFEMEDTTLHKSRDPDYLMIEAFANHEDAELGEHLHENNDDDSHESTTIL
jgi:hypothetical protein